MAIRFPDLQRLLYRLNMAPFFRALGALPIENQPLVRPLASFGTEILKTYGNLPLEEVFNTEALHRLGTRSSDRLTSLWNQRLAKSAQQSASLRDLKQPYRNWFIKHQRELLEEQLEALKDAVVNGDTLYIAPEGRYSTDGRVGRFRLACFILHDASQLHYIAWLSYDPLVKRRMHVYLHICPSRPDILLEMQVRAMRPITVGHLLAHWLLIAGKAAFTKDDAERAVELTVQQLPYGARLAVPSARQRARIVGQSLNYMTYLGILNKQQEDRYTVGSIRKHKIFPLVEDILEHQRNALQDIMDALHMMSPPDSPNKEDRA